MHITAKVEEKTKHKWKRWCRGNGHGGSLKKRHFNVP